MNLSEVAKQIKEKGDPSPMRARRRGRGCRRRSWRSRAARSPLAERANILSVDPKRCRPWKYHNRSNAWYTKERCQDLIDSIVKDGQLEPALARKLTGDPKFDFELIYGMRRRFAAEFTHTKLKIRLTEADDAKAAVLMHIENADRQDITRDGAGAVVPAAAGGEDFRDPGCDGRGLWFVGRRKCKALKAALAA